MTSITLVTGATGLIGGAVIDQLRRRSSTVRILVRDPTRLTAAQRAGVEICQGDIRSPLRVAVAARGVETVLHLAAHAHAWSRDPADFTAVNVGGVENLLAAAMANGVRRFVHVSTILTHPMMADRRWPGRRLTAYERTKLEADRLVASALDRGLGAIVVRPTRVYGPGPLGESNGVTRLIDAALRYPVVGWLDDRGTLGNYCHVDDVAQGIVMAAERGEVGGDYIVGGENLAMTDLLGLVAEFSGRRPLVASIPPRLAMAAGYLAIAAGRFGVPVRLTPEWVRMFLEDHRVDITPTTRALGYSPRAVREGIAETIQWLEQRSRPRGPLGYPRRA